VANKTATRGRTGHFQSPRLNLKLEVKSKYDSQTLDIYLVQLEHCIVSAPAETSTNTQQSSHHSQAVES
jgi:hypothetical protein